MSSNFERGNGGIHRICGRKSIHNHGSYCPFFNEDMGRYGMSSNMSKEQAICNNSQEGTDEIDNVMSKSARASSPTENRNIEILRRNSLDSPKHQQNYTDDSDDDDILLSKSSPAIFSPYSCCREPPPEQANITTYSSGSLDSWINRTNVIERRAYMVDGTPLPCPESIRVNVDNTNKNRQESKAKGTTVKLVLIALIGIVVAFCYNLLPCETEVNNIIYDKQNFYNDVKVVGNKYQINDNSILQVRAGIATIFERQDTGSFIFVYNSESRNFNTLNFNNFIIEIVTAAARYLRNHTKTVQHVVVDPSNLRVHSVKELMDEYSGDVDKTGVMLVKDLDKVPSAMAMAFHYYCDEYNPLVKKSAIFFTLNVARCTQSTSEKYTHENIEKCLTDKWENMPRDNMKPLLTRVVNVVIDVTSDF